MTIQYLNISWGTNIEPMTRTKLFVCVVLNDSNWHRVILLDYKF